MSLSGEICNGADDVVSNHVDGGEEEGSSLTSTYHLDMSLNIRTSKTLGEESEKYEPSELKTPVPRTECIELMNFAPTLQC